MKVTREQSGVPVSVVMPPELLLAQLTSLCKVEGEDDRNSI